MKTHSEVHQGCWTLTRDLHSEGVAADANEVEGHALHRHPAVGQPHGEDALHLHGSVLLPLHLHRESLGMVLLRQSCVVPIAPASLQRTHKQTVIIGRTATDSRLKIPVCFYSRRPYPRTLVPDDLGSRISKGGAGERGYIFPPHHSNGFLCQQQQENSYNRWKTKNAER